MPRLQICDPAELPGLLPDALNGAVTLVPLSPGQDASWVQASVDDPEAAVVVTTSGSTGTPKGVCLPASALVASARAMASEVGALDWWCPLPTQHVAGLMTLVRAHVAGAQWRAVEASLADLPLPTRPTAMSLVATQLHRALDNPALVAKLRALEVILVGGSAIRPGLLERARELGLAVRTTYGMSETCGGCVHDGHPLPGADVAVDADGRITIAGPMLFSGYLGRPDLTAEALVDGRLVTHDRGRLDDGVLTVLGRFDDVVISGGVNVDLAAVQRAVNAPDTVVVGVPDAEWGTAVALVTTGSLPLDAWRERLRASGLEAAALPTQLQRRATLPHTASGKIDRLALVRGFTADERHHSRGDRHGQRA